MSGDTGSAEADTFTISGIPTIVGFADRQARIVEHMTLDQFVQVWDDGEDSFSNNPPDADLSVLTSGDADVNIVVELLAVHRLSHDSLRFECRLLEGRPPVDDFGASTLFVDGCMSGKCGK